MKLSFVGDVCLAGVFRDKIDFISSNEIFSNDVKTLLGSSDYTVCNLEGPVTEEECVLSRKLNVKSPTGTIPFLQKNGVNVFGLANNHMFDAQYQGFVDTRNELRRYQGIFFGAGDNIEEASQVCYLEKNDVTIALIGVGHHKGEVASGNNAGIFTYTDKKTIKKRIAEAKQKSDWVIIFCHIGPEYNFYPTPLVRERMKEMINFGADIIVGHHPHVIQGYEFLEKNKLIIYSLGNFVFDLPSTRNKKGHNIGMIASLDFKRDSFLLEMQPTSIDINNGKISFALNEYRDLLKEISDFSNYEKKIAKESLRCIFFNPFLPKDFKKKIIFVLLYPLVSLYKLYNTRGYNREFVDISLKYYRLSFLKKFLNNDEFYKSK